MRLLTVLVLVLSFLATAVFGETIRTDPSTATWVDAVSSDAQVATSSLIKIKIDTPEKEMNALLKTALLKVQEMRESVKPYGLIVEGFSVNLSVPPSINVDFKFKE